MKPAKIKTLQDSIIQDAAYKRRIQAYEDLLNAYEVIASDYNKTINWLATLGAIYAVYKKRTLKKKYDEVQRLRKLLTSLNLNTPH